MARIADDSVKMPAAAVAWPRPGRPAWAALAGILLVGAAAGLAFGGWPGLDLAVTATVFDAVHRSWPYAHVQALQAVRDVNDAIVRAAAVAAGVVLIIGLVPARWRLVRLPEALSVRAALFVLASLAVAPGLIINGLLKPHGGRPRPIEVTEFGGTLDFVPWWSPFGRCDGNCSFASGEMSSAIWLVSVAVLLPTRWRPLAVAVVLAWALAVGGVRIAMGGHFASDVILSGVLTALTVWVLYALIMRPAERSAG